MAYNNQKESKNGLFQFSVFQICQKGPKIAKNISPNLPEK